MAGASGPKIITFSIGAVHFVKFNCKILLPVQVKLYALKARELLLWVSPAWRALFFLIFTSSFLFFTKCFKTYTFGKSIGFKGKRDLRFRPGLVVKNYIFGC